MRLGKYVMDKLAELLIAAFALLVVCGMLLLCRAPSALVAAVCVVWLAAAAAIFAVSYGKKHRFYQELVRNAERLDQKYLVLETIQEPHFYEGEIVYQVIYEADKSMTENVKKYRRSIEDFKDYVEMWVHEVKLPIASLQLMCHNNRDVLDSKYETQIRRLDNYTDQVLYYVRSEHAHKDYLIKQVKLADIVCRTAIKNKDDLLLGGIAFSVEVPDTFEVTTDSKWMEFMLGQILSNSIKYAKADGERIIRIFAEREKNIVALHVWDNGIGIPDADLPRLFEKSFTGENGRTHVKSTGMGLYIVKKLCDKLGHQVSVRSVRGEYTDVSIRITGSDFYRVA